MINNRTHIGLAIITVLLLIISGCDTTSQNQSDAEELQTDNIIPGQYIVVMKDGNTLTKAPKGGDFDNRASASRGVDREAHIQAVNTMLSDIGVQPDAIKNYYSHAISGFTVNMDEQAVKQLEKDARVKYIEQDKRIQLDPYQTFDGELPEGDNKGDNVSAPGDFVPYGIDRVGGSVSGSGEFAWVIDTGIDLDHPDLNVNTQYSETFVSGTSSPNDGNGHGTHVAGTIGALSNGSGVIGVSPGTTLFAVRVLGSNGSGTNSGVIAGVDHVTRLAFSGEVANMSLGGGVSSALDDAIRNCANSGVRLSIAAGNSSAFAGNSSPARVNHPNVRTVSAIDSNDNFASFSNFGNPPVDWAAPGVQVWSTWIGGQYNRISGTSMAAPHVGGLMVTGTITTGGFANGDPDGDPDPISVRN